MKLEFYNLPFKSAFYDNWVYDANGDFAFQIESVKHKSLILETLNGNQSQHLEIFTLTICDEDSSVILNKGEPFITIRKSNTIAHEDLTLEQVRDIQNDLRDWIIHKLSN